MTLTNINPNLDPGEGGGTGNGQENDFDTTALQVLQEAENVAEIAALIQGIVASLEAWAGRLGIQNPEGQSNSDRSLHQRLGNRNGKYRC